jgi:hypothetical protein
LGEAETQHMPQADFEHYFDKSYALASNTILTVTEAPESAEQLLRLLEGAMLGGFGHQAPLTQIHLPMERFPFMDSKFWHVPVEDSGKNDVLRFFFETPAEAPAQEARLYADAV